MINKKVIMELGLLLLASAAGSIFVVQAEAQTPAAPPKKPAVAPYRNQPVHLPPRAHAYYESVWGIDSPSVKAVESGELVRFSFRVVDADKAKVLNDKKLSPILIDPEAGVQLVVPSMQNVGMLRQAPDTTEAGRSYWMAFSNPGRMVRPGHRVIVQIGNFKAEGLTVE
jgi:hypothetical protein